MIGTSANDHAVNKTEVCQSLSYVTNKQKMLVHKSKKGEKCIIPIDNEGRNVLFNDTLNNFYLWSYCIKHMVKNHSERERKSTAAITLAILFN